MKPRLCPVAAVLAILLEFAACAGHQQSAVDPAGPQAGKIATLWWFFLAVLGLIFLIVMAMTLATLLRNRRAIPQESIETPHRGSAETETKLTRIVTGATIATVIILFVLLVFSVGTGKAISELGDTKNGMVIEVQGNQWWWYVRYQNDNPRMVLVTANEIHIPTGRPVMIRGSSLDVIHSFWVPNLHGKRDLIPSRTTTEWIQANQPGTYRGQCAEFCGLQHAHMSLWVIAEPEDKFKSWFDQQLQPITPPTDSVKLRGQQVFLDHACIFCHSIQGTPAAGQMGPDLTHFGSRKSIAAGTLPNNKGNLAGWITNPQNIKPGNHMATIALKSEDLQPLLEYLESLK